LTGLGLDRGAGETFSAWFARLGRTGRIRTDELQALLNLHNRLRFDPAGLVDAERGRLRSEVEAWLRKEARGIGIGMNRGR
jgi:hypothetical protein